MRRFLVLLSALVAARASAQDMVGVTWNGQAFAIDSTTGAGALIGPTGFVAINAMAVDVTGTIYASAGFTIITVDPSTGVGTPVVTVAKDVRAMAIDVNGLFHLVVDGDPDELWTYDVATNALLKVGATGFPGIQGLAFAPDGTLYAWDIGLGAFGDGLLTIDLFTGAATDVNPTVGADGGGLVQFLAARSDGTIIGGRHKLFSIDATTGTQTLIGGSGYSELRGAEFVSPCVATSRHYGDGVPGTTGVPSLVLNGIPLINALVTLGVGNSSGTATQVLLLMGSSPASIPGFWGGDLLLVPIVAMALPLPGSGFVISTTIPNDPLLCGARLYIQGLQSDPGAAQGVSSSRGLEIRFGM